MANLVIAVLKNTRYRFKELMEEKELVEVEKKMRGKKEIPVIYRNGMTQGSPLSPIISTTVLEC
jgi:hypothetical protein